MQSSLLGWGRWGTRGVKRVCLLAEQLDDQIQALVALVIAAADAASSSLLADQLIL